MPQIMQPRLIAGVIVAQHASMVPQPAEGTFGRRP